MFLNLVEDRKKRQRSNECRRKIRELMILK
jgi:hypothetical protein